MPLDVSNRVEDDWSTDGRKMVYERLISGHWRQIFYEFGYHMSRSVCEICSAALPSLDAAVGTEKAGPPECERQNITSWTVHNAWPQM